MKRLLLIALAFGCRDRTPAPSELALSPDRGRDDRETPVLISGRFIAAAFEIDRRDVKQVRPLTIRLGDRELDAVLSGQGMMRAVVPAGIAPGPQALEAVDPYGQTARREDAFCVLGPEAQVAGFEVETASSAVAGEPFALSLIARDADREVVVRFEGFARVSTSTVGPFVRGAWSGPIAIGNVRTTSLQVEVDRSKDPARDCSPDTGRAEVPIRVEPGAPAALFFSSAPDSMVAGGCSPPVEIGVTDKARNPVAADSRVEVGIRTSVPTDLFADPDCTLPLLELSIAPGEHTAALHFRAPAAPSLTLEALAPPLAPAAHDVSIDLVVPDRVAIVSPPRTIVEGTCSDPVWVELHDTGGNPIAAPSALTVDLATEPSTVAKAAADSGCLVGTAMVVIPAGESRAPVFVVGVLPGSSDLVVSAPNLGGDRQTQTVIASMPSELRFITPPRAISSGHCSEPLVVALLDAAGNPSPAIDTFPVAFIASSPPGDFATYSDPDCTVPAATIDMPAGASQVTIYFSGITPAVVPLTASALLIFPDTQDATVRDAMCGDGRIDGSEPCDDANTIDGDGCSASCIVEPNFVCGREPSVCLSASETAVVDDDTCPAVGTGTDANPYCQISVALVSPNVLIRSGIYGESVVISGQTRRLIAEPGAVLLGGNNALTVQTGSDVEVVGLAIQSATGNGILVADTSVLTLTDATIGPTQANGVHSTGSSSIRIHRTRFNNCDDAIRIDGSGPFDITSTIIADTGDDGMIISSNATNGRLHGLTVVNTSQVGIVCNASGVVLMNSIVWGSGMRDLDAPCSAVSSDYLSGPGGMSNLSVDPDFAPDGSYHLLTTSPLIDMGSAVDAPPDDFDGQPRVQGPGIDIGADEVQ